MPVLFTVLTVLECVAIGAALVLTALILRQLHEMETEPTEKPPKAEEDGPSDAQRRVEQGFDNLMRYDTDTAKASRKGQGDVSWR